MIGALQQFSHLDQETQSRLFARAPVPAAPGSAAGIADRLGATLYTPATRPTLKDDVYAAMRAGTVSMVLDLEDSVHEQRVADATDNLVAVVKQIARARDVEGPLPIALFIRVRAVDHITQILDRLGEAALVLSGIVVPKFAANSAGALVLVREAGAALGHQIRVMPVVETREFIAADRRIGALADLREALAPFRDDILAVRIGGTDLAGIYGVRRTPDLTIYDVHLVSSALADIVNMLGHPEEGYPVSGPVWEHFAPRERVLRPQLRSTPFVEQNATAVREQLLNYSYDGLIREVLLDRANGMTGKSVIHPDQAAVVNAISVVTDEEFRDAEHVAQSDLAGGATASDYGNKMNESRPHAAWAQRTLRRADAFGVSRPGHGYVEILTATVASQRQT